MNFSNLAFKLNSLFMSGNFMYHASSMAADGDVVNTLEATSIAGETLNVILNGLVNIILKIIYTICAFLLNLIEFFQFIVSNLLGISVDTADYVVLDTKNPLIKMLTNEEVLSAFKIIFGLAILLIIVFTIFAIVKTEYKYAVTGDEKTTSKGRIMLRSLRSFFTLGMFPFIILFAIILVNALLAGFNDVLRQDTSVTLAGQIFATGAYSGNNYRNYANKDMRIPILINFEDPIYLGQDSGYSPEELAKIYENFSPKGSQLYTDFAYKDFSSFNDTIVYRNNSLYNQADYSGFEQFVCTREQYYVMADFIDYAIKHNIRYYVKAMDDVDVSWKYVSNTIYDKENQSLKITYKDVSNLSGKSEYTVVYSPSEGDVSTPISDAIKTVSALLAIGDYSDNGFNALSRLEDSINIVEWTTDKAYLKLSNTYQTKRTATDSLLLYERARFEYNNTLNYTIDELKKGVELPVFKLDKRVWQGSSASYVVYDSYYVVSINGTYYMVELNEELKDESGNLLLDAYNDHYYSLVESEFSTFKLDVSGSDDGVDLYGNGNKYVKDEGAFKDIIVEKTNGTFGVELENGDISYSDYDDQLSKVVKQVSWPEKLINDLQIIYKDININHLITTDKWLEQLGEYVSADDTTGEYTGNISTALIHPLGLILSELFLGEIEESDAFNLYGSLMFNSKFDQETVKALMLSLVGEDKYFQLKAEFEHFNELFNVFMGPVLDEIAYYESFDLMDGQTASVQLYTYKAYLASILISSSAAEWLGETALSLIGYSGLETEIINGFGYYKTYASLSEEYRTLILELYLENIKVLKEQYVEAGDRAYPEYMEALKQYMGRYPITTGAINAYKETYSINDDFLKTHFLEEGEEQFDGALGRVLASYLTDEKQYEIVGNAHRDIYTSYIALKNYINTNCGTDANALIEFIDSVIFVPAERTAGDDYSKVSDEFTTANIEYTINNLEIQIDSMDYQIEIFLDSQYLNERYYTAIKPYLSDYYEAIKDYVDEKLDYITPDQSHKFNGKMDDLEKDKEKALRQAEILYNYMYTNYYNILKSSLHIDFNSLIDPKDSFFGLIEGDVSGANNISSWNDLVEKVENLRVKADNMPTIFVENQLEANLARSMVETYVSCMERYIESQVKIDRLNRYYITYGVSAILKSQSDISLNVVVNNKHYTVGQNFTRAKFIEYVLGNQVKTIMNDEDFELVFVEDDYKGLITVSPDGTYVTGSSFTTMQEFLVELGDITAVLEQMTNLVNLSDGSVDEIVISTGANSLSGKILTTILNSDYLATDLIKAFFDITQNVGGSGDAYTQNIKNLALEKVRTANATKNDEWLNTVLSYLLLTDPSDTRPSYIDYSSLTLQEFRKLCMEFLIDYEEQKGESVEQNQNRYLCVFALACSDWSKADGTGAVNNSWYKEDRGEITSLKVDKQAQATVLRLAGLDNRPYEEMVGAEYTINFENKGIDEANGDVFVICTFDQETKMFLPFMMTNNEHAEGEGLPTVEGDTWASYTGFFAPYTEYYTTGSDETAYFPVIAKGIIDHKGMPTAIRENEGNIEYYRDDIVIHDVGKYGLSQYFVSVDQIPVNHTSISYFANMFTEMITGKSLVEKLVANNPRIAANSDFKFLYGKDRTVAEISIDGLTAISFNFDESVCIDMEYLYTLENMNIVVLLIGVFAIISALWKAVWGVTQRMFDVTIYFLLGPAVISVIPLKTDKMNKKKQVEESTDDAYERWKSTLTQRLLSVFAYAIGFNIFFVVIPIISRMNIFDTTSMFASLPLFRNINVQFLNELTRVVFLIASAYLCSRAPDMFASLSKTGNGFDDGEKALGNVKNTINEVKDHWSGRYAMDKAGTAVERAKGAIPGVELGRAAYGKVQQVSNKVVGKVAESYLIAHGVDPKTSRAMSDALVKNMEARQNESKLYRQQKDSERRAREKNRGAALPNISKQEAKAQKDAKKKLGENRKKHKDAVNKYDAGRYTGKGKRTK